MYAWHLWCRFVHITPQHTQHWHWSVCCTVAWRLVSWHTRNQCQMSVAGRWQLAAHWCLLQIVCQPGTSKGIQVLDITEPHTANQTCDWQWHYRWDVMDHPPCIPYLMPSNFCLFGPLKKHLTGKWFTTDSGMKQGVTYWLQTVDIDSFYAKIQSPGLITRQIFKCQWWLFCALKCPTCYPHSLYISKCPTCYPLPSIYHSVPPATHMPSIYQSHNKFLGIRVFLS